MSARDRVVDLIDRYLWCTRGSDPDDDYNIRDEDDFDQFVEELDRVLEGEQHDCR